MSDSQDHLERIQQQFTKQADAYVRMRQTTDEAGLGGLVALTGVQPHESVLDVACGPGFLTLAFAARAAKVVGIDATETFLERARAEAERRGSTNVEFRSGDAEHLPFADASFDVVACRAAFHHFLHPERVLAEMKRITRAGGRLLIADMLGSDDPAKAELHTRIERLCDPTHVRALPEAEFDALFREAGVEVVLRPRSLLHHDVEEWLDHGGPSDEARREILSLLELSLDGDRASMQLRRENGRLRFSYTGVAFLVRVHGA
jgi:ubiquinone/menaquinone biosynthesis C-methylase UbiE